MSQQPQQQVKRNRYMIGRTFRLEMDPDRVSATLYSGGGIEPIDIADSEAREVLRNRRLFYYSAVALALVGAIVRQPLLFVAALLVTALTIIPEVWYRYGLRQLAIERVPETTRAVFGDRTEVTLRIENRKLLPLPFLEIVDDFPDVLPVERMKLGPSSKPERATLTNTVSLWAYERLRRRYRLHAVARGAYRFGPMTLRAGDPFGFLTRETTARVPATLLVHPLVAPIERFGLVSNAPFGDRKAPRRLLEDPLRISGIRDYEPGDEPRRIHWKATARTGTLQSKVYEPSTRHTLAVFVEVRTYHRSLMGYDAQLVELAISAAASVATWALDQKYAVGVYSNGTVSTVDMDLAPLPYRDLAGQPREDAGSPAAGGAGSGEHGGAPTFTASELAARVGSSLRLRVPPAARAEQEVRILDGLARLLPYYGLPMDELLARELRTLPFGATVVYIGAEAAVDVPLILALRRLREKGHAVSLLLTRPDVEDTTGDERSTPDSAMLHLANLPIHYLGGRRLWRDLEEDVLGPDVRRKASSFTRQSELEPDGQPPDDMPPPTSSFSALRDTGASVWSADAARMKGQPAAAQPDVPARAAHETAGEPDIATNRGTVEGATGTAGRSDGPAAGRSGWRKARSLVVE